MIKWFTNSSDLSILFEVRGHNKLIGMGTLIDKLMTRSVESRLRVWDLMPFFITLDEIERIIPIHINDRGYFRYDTVQAIIKKLEGN